MRVIQSMVSASMQIAGAVAALWALWEMYAACPWVSRDRVILVGVAGLMVYAVGRFGDGGR